MRKLRLELDALSVESFSTQTTEQGKGTVAARQSASTLITYCNWTCAATCAYTCDDATCPACPTCADSCNGSCAATCIDTCGVSCWDTCRPRACGTTIP